LIGEDYSSKFSAWLALGCISPRFIYRELQKYEIEFGANDST
jgi:deoxyribodipyrimidine photo-lyase